LICGNNVVWGDSDPVEVGLPDTIENRQFMASIGSGTRLESLDNDILSALYGNDTMYGGPGADSMTLGSGNDWAYGGQGNDSIALGAGDDRGYGGLGNDTLTGSGGNDLVSGGEGNDSVNGDQGLDVLIGGGGSDGVNGGDGNDLLFDGRISLGGQSAESQTVADASDAAMLALLLEWAASNPAAGPLATAAATSNDRDGTDQVRGNLSDDSFSADPADIFDFAVGLDTVL
jgi:Ca2+-binding RTX toxin-like protein